ncbi:bifunctional UDP-N-acetylglucosamine diphosphorylase/glucosamine-1-phosphate N-acetyltransferase GlmU [Oscillospiraceae bacterium PP1C4]
MSIKNRRKFAIILAAGDGKRMKCDQPKVLCEVLFQPMLKWVENACRSAGLDEIYIVAGDQPDALSQVVSSDCSIVIQAERRGTGHAVMMAADALGAGGDVIVLYGDAPFINEDVINAALAQHQAQRNAVTVVTAKVSDPTGYGRIIRGADGEIAGIVEQKDATDAQRKIDEINSGVYWFDAAFLADALQKLTCQNAQGEYYLTDTVKIALETGARAGGFLCEDGDVILGANDRKGLKLLNEIARNREIDRHLSNGVDIPLDDGVIIGLGVFIDHDARIMPGTVLLGDTKIGAHAVIGPNSYIKDSTVGAGSSILSSYLTDSTVGEGTTVGPFTQLRPNSHIGNGAKIGDFVEVKNSTIGDKTSVAHLTYIGDADVGSQVNFGCGVVIANYDGIHKFRTTIGDRAFIGCNTNLIPPVRVGEGAYTAAGTTVDSDVPDGALSIGRARQEIKEQWAAKNINFKGGKKATEV